MTLPLLISDADDDSPSSTPPEHLRHEIVQLEKMQKQILADMETLRQQEANLRAYETRLREAHPQVCPVPAGAASASPQDLHAAWEKYQRAHALLEAERRALCDERLAFREDAAALKVREEELKRRESWVTAREQALKPPPAQLQQQKLKAVSSNPFVAARDFLTNRRKKNTAA